MNYEIILYETERGRSEVEQFIKSMPAKSKAKLYMIIALLQEKGTAVPMPYSRYLQNGIYEVRVITGMDSFRILYFFVKDQKIVFTNGFRKKPQTMPVAEISKAMKMKEDYQRRLLDESI